MLVDALKAQCQKPIATISRHCLGMRCESDQPMRWGFPVLTGGKTARVWFGIGVGLAVGILACFALGWSVALRCHVAGLRLEVTCHRGSVSGLAVRWSSATEPMLGVAGRPTIDLCTSTGSVGALGLAFSFLPLSYRDWDYMIPAHLGLAVPWWVVVVLGGWICLGGTHAARSVQASPGACSTPLADAPRVWPRLRFTVTQYLLWLIACAAVFATFRLVVREWNVFGRGSSLVTLCVLAAATLSPWWPAAKAANARLSLAYLTVLGLLIAKWALRDGIGGLDTVWSIAHLFKVVVAASFGLGFSLSRLRARDTRVLGLCFVSLFSAVLLAAVARLYSQGALS